VLTTLTHLASRIRALFRSRQLDEELEQELQSHLDMLTEDNVRRGLPLDEARREARLRIGSTDSLKESHREVRAMPTVDAMVQDVRFACRVIGKDRWFSLAVIAVLALGIGANAVGFTIVNTGFLKGMPLLDSDRLATPCRQVQAGPTCSIPYSEFETWRAGSSSFSNIEAYDGDVLNISDDRAFPEQVRGVFITPDLLGTLGLEPILGRNFVPSDNSKGAEPVVIIAHRLWQARFGGDPKVLGRVMRINGQPATIIGVMPERMNFPENHDLWAPWVPFHSESNDNRLDVVGKLRPGVTLEQAAAELTVISKRLAAAHPDASEDLVAIHVESFTEQSVGGGARTMFTLVMGGVSFLLLIACANVANMLLARSGYRAQEIAIRMTLGATRWRIVRQFLVESLLLGFIAGAVGLVLAGAGVHLFESVLQDSDKPYWLVFTIDYTVAGYIAAICVVTGAIFGVAPALQVTRVENVAASKENERGSLGSRRTRRLSSVLVVTELTLAVVLLAGAGLMTRSFFKLYSVQLGFNADDLVMFGMDLLEPTYRTAEDVRVFSEELESRVASIPGIESAAVTSGVPPQDRVERLLEIERPAPAPQEQPRFVSTAAITPSFLDVLGIPVIRGRNFTRTDGEPGAETVLINQRLADEFFPGEDPIGKRLRFTARRQTPDAPPQVWRTVIGVTPTIRQGSVRDAYLNAVVYVPFRQEPDNGAYLLVRSRLPLGAISNAVRSEVQAIDRNQPLRPAQTLEQWMARDRWLYRVFGGVFGILAIIALTLSSAGLYAVVAYAVMQRTNEIGLRMAVGAQRHEVVWLVLKRGLLQLGMGLAVGLAGALALSQVFVDFLVDIRPTDPGTLAAITFTLTIVCISACLLPARRAARIDPLVALHRE
jgi:putative ABC transport system permease protein